MPAKKILICSDYIFGELAGGAARVSTDLALSLKEKKEIFLFIRGLKDSPSFENFEGLKIFRHKDNPLTVFRQLSDIFSSGIDIVNFHDPLSSFLCLFYMKLKSIKAKKIYTFQSSWGYEYKIRALKKQKFAFFIFLGKKIRDLIERFLIVNSDRIFVASSFMADFAEKKHGKKVFLATLGVDEKRFSLLEKEEKKSLIKDLNLPADKKIFFTLRNLEPRMGLDNLILALETVKKQFNNFFLIIGGVGSMEKELKALALEKGLNEHIRFEGKIPDDRLKFYYGAADAFIIPTKEFEGFGLVTAEAMMCGLPVLATPAASNLEIAGAFSGNIIFKGISPDDMALGLAEFLAKQNCPKEELKKRARDFALKNYSLAGYAAKMEKIFDEM